MVNLPTSLTPDTTCQHHWLSSQTLLSFDKALGSGQTQSSWGGESNVAEVDTAAETKAADRAGIGVDVAGEDEVDAVGETAAGTDAEPDATGASEVNPPRGFEADVVVAEAEAAVEVNGEGEAADEVEIDAEGEVTSGCLCSEFNIDRGCEVTSGCFCSEHLKFRVDAGGEVTSGCFCSENLDAST